MASMLAKAAGRADAAFIALPPKTRQAVALAMHRVAPAFEQYQRDLAPLTQSDEFADAFFDVAIALAFKLIKKGRTGDWRREIEEMKTAAPNVAGFMVDVARLIDGMLPGFMAPIDVAAGQPALAERSLPPPDALVEPEDRTEE